MPTLFAIAGLPGSGKSYLLKELKEELQIEFAADDYMKESNKHSSKLKESKHHDKLVESLNSGSDCIVADIEFVREEKRNELLDTLSPLVPALQVRWIYFANDWQQCLNNIERWAGSHYEKRVRDEAALLRLRDKYFIPEGVETRPVWSLQEGDQ